MEKENFFKTVIKVTLKTLFVVVLFVIFCLLPDIFYHIREFLLIFPQSSFIICTNISSDDYIKIVMAPLFSCIAVSVSILALQTANKTGSIQLVKQKEKAIISSRDMLTVIKDNMIEIKEIRNNTGNISRLVENNSPENAVFLYTNKMITTKQYNCFLEFIDSIQKIKKMHNSVDSRKEERAVEKFCETYYDRDLLNFSKELRELVDCLEELAKEEN